jgi:hypothetical protein
LPTVNSTVAEIPVTPPRLSIDIVTPPTIGESRHPFFDTCMYLKAWNHRTSINLRKICRKTTTSATVFHQGAPYQFAGVGPVLTRC